MILKDLGYIFILYTGGFLEKLNWLGFSGLDLMYKEKNLNKAYYRRAVRTKDGELEHQIGRLTNFKKILNKISKENIRGDFIEFGVWKGFSLLWIAYLSRRLGLFSRKIVGIDSFRGLPYSEGIFKKNSFSDTSVWECRRNVFLSKYLSRTVKNNIHIEKFLFSDKEKIINRLKSLGVNKFCFVHIDSDLSKSFLDVIDILIKGDFLEDHNYLLIDDHGFNVKLARVVDKEMDTLKRKWKVRVHSKTKLSKNYELIKKMEYKVLITTSGIGSRLGDYTKFTNKSLVRVGRKPAISYIVEQYPKKLELVITLGYYANHVKDFLKLTYPDRKFTFVEVDKYKGQGSSLLYSMVKAEPHLRCPFIYHACDTIIEGVIPAPKVNWNGGCKGEGSSKYASFDVLNGHVQEIYDKGMLEPDYLHIGLVGVNDYRLFWKIAKQMLRKYPDNGELSDVFVIREMLRLGSPFGLKVFTRWYDIGNVESLNVARKEIGDSLSILDKMDESIFLYDKFVVKFFANSQVVSDRVKRAARLKGLVPKIIDYKDNFYKYSFIEGQLLSEIFDPEDFSTFLKWSKAKLWKPCREVSEEKFYKVCKKFYYDKTLYRVNEFLNSRLMKDSQHVINGLVVPPIKKILQKVDWNLLCAAEQTSFHGDYILDNILKTKSGYCLLDWRQDFGGLLTGGDMYYDLGKLNHNLTVSHSLINRNLFTIRVRKDGVSCDVLRKNNLVECEKIFWEFIKKNNYNEKKIRLITPLIWLNMSPLHTHPFDLFLFYFGKYNLWRAINE
jgi:hypothetical protein